MPDGFADRFKVVGAYVVFFCNAAGSPEIYSRWEYGRYTEETNRAFALQDAMRCGGAVVRVDNSGEVLEPLGVGSVFQGPRVSNTGVVNT